MGHLHKRQESEGLKGHFRSLPGTAFLVFENHTTLASQNLPQQWLSILKGKGARSRQLLLPNTHNMLIHVHLKP